MFTPQVVKPPTSSDVAHAAGVSRATVSFVLNDKPGVRISDDTRRRVLEAAQRLGYTPNQTAQTLARASVAGWLVAGAQQGFGDALDRAVDLAVREAVDDGADVVRDGGTDTVGSQAAQAWSRYRPESVLAGADRCDAAATEVLRSSGVRALLVYSDVQVEHAPTLVLPQAPYGRLAAEHLVARGHRHLAFVLPSGRSGADARFAAARAVARDAGATLTRVDASPTAASLRDWAHGWRYADDRPTGVLAFDDAYAAAAVRALVDAGVRVPDDVSVVGAEDQPLAGQYVPRLTSVSFASDVLAGRISAAFRAMLAGERVERVEPPTPVVVERESVTAVTR